MSHLYKSIFKPTINYIIPSLKNEALKKYLELTSQVFKK